MTKAVRTERNSRFLRVGSKEVPPNRRPFRHLEITRVTHLVVATTGIRRIIQFHFKPGQLRSIEELYAVHRREEASSSHLYFPWLLHACESVGKPLVSQVLQFIALVARVDVHLIRDLRSLQPHDQFEVLIIKTRKFLVFKNKTERRLRGEFLVEMDDAGCAVCNDALVE